ncbi:SPRY domain-containing SOCS box 3-like [Brachionus plicatilis]|uniref:SPRY domain-containing SOCS box 3-like n=1 Tax=Brachionus plicatilis TaxID=10195 RepID=A0A3M7QGX2_BRAPC|nr:SPRY domain-containing SOCS box 3-like [Brachionus plicatilis]
MKNIYRTHPLIAPQCRIQMEAKWNTEAKSEFATILPDSKTVLFFDGLESKGTAATRLDMPVTFGSFYFEFTVREPLFGTAVMFGLGTEDIRLSYDDYNYVPLIGMNQNGWALSYKGTVWHNGKYKKFCEPFFEENTCIGMLYHNKKIHYFIDGVYRGIAFDNVDPNGKQLYPMVSSTAADTVIELTTACRLNYSLLDLCAFKVKKLFKDEIQQLDLPKNLIIFLAHF